MDTRRAILAGKAHFPHHAVLRIGVREPREALLARGAGDHLALSIDQELRLIETLPGAGLPAGIVSHRPDDRDGMVTLTVDQDMGVGITLVDQVRGGQQIAWRQRRMDDLHHVIVWGRRRRGLDIDNPYNVTCL